LEVVYYLQLLTHFLITRYIRPLEALKGLNKIYNWMGIKYLVREEVLILKLIP